MVSEQIILLDDIEVYLSSLSVYLSIYVSIYHWSPVIIYLSMCIYKTCLLLKQIGLLTHTHYIEEELWVHMFKNARYTEEKQMRISTIRCNSISIHVISIEALIKHLHIAKRETRKKLNKTLGGLPNQGWNLNTFGKDICIISLFNLVSMETNIY